MQFTARLIAALLLGTTGSLAVAAGTIADKVTVNDPYVRAVPPVVKTSAAFMQLQSSDIEERFLVAASSPAAGVVELHMHTMDDGVMRMRQIPHIHLPPDQTVALEAFKAGGLEFTPQASAHVAKPRRAADASFRPSVAVFSLSKKGAMVEAAVGTTAFQFEPP